MNTKSNENIIEKMSFNEIKFSNEFEWNYVLHLTFKINSSKNINKNTKYVINIKKIGLDWVPSSVCHYYSGECEFCNGGSSGHPCSLLTKYKNEIFNKIINSKSMRLRWLKYENHRNN